MGEISRECGLLQQDMEGGGIDGGVEGRGNSADS